MSDEGEDHHRRGGDQMQRFGQLSSECTSLLAAADIASLVVDRDLRIAQCTPAMAQLLATGATASGLPISDISHELGDVLADDAAAVLRGLIPIERELRDDDDHWYLTRVLPYRTADDRVDGVVITMVDITSQKRAEAVLRDSEELYRTTADQLPLLVWVTNSSGELEWANRTYRSYFGLRTETAAGYAWSSLVHPDDLDGFLRRFEDARDQQSDLHAELRVRHADGSWRWLEIWGHPRLGHDGRFLGHLGTSADITDRVRAEAALRIAAEGAALRAELMDALRRFDDPGDVQAAACQVIGERFGASRTFYASIEPEGDSLVVEVDHGHDLGSVVGAHPLEALGPSILVSLQRGEAVVVEDVARDARCDDRHRSSKLVRGVGAHVIAPLVSEGRLVAIMVAQDASPRAWSQLEVAFLEEAVNRTWSAVERSQARRAVRLGEERLRRVLDSVPSVLFTTDGEGRVEMTIGQVHSILGVQPATVTGAAMWSDLVHDDDRERVATEWARTRECDEDHEVRYRLAATGRWVMVRVVPIRDDAGRIVQWFGTITDVDDLVTTELALAHINETLEQRVAEGMSQARELASRLSRAEHDERRRLGQILHDDLQQLLYGIQLKLTGAHEMLVSDAALDADQRIDDVQELLQRAIEITRNLTVDLSPPLLPSDGIGDALEWLVSYMDDLHDLHVEVQLDDEVDLDEGTRTMLFHVTRELLFNVAKHGGTDRATVRLGRADADLVLAVEDSGRGFDPAALEDGTGVGLAHVRERVQLLSGDFEIDARPGGGCAVTVRIPLRRTGRDDLPPPG